MSSARAAGVMGFAAGIATCAVFALVVLGTEPRELYVAPFPDRFDTVLAREIERVRPGGRLVNEGRIYRRCEDRDGRVVGAGDGTEVGDPHDGRFIEYRPDGTKTTWLRAGGLPALSMWCWRS